MNRCCAQIYPPNPPIPTTNPQIILYTGSNEGYQLFVSSSGPEANEIPYVISGISKVVAFSGSLNDATLPAGQYFYYICKNVISNSNVQQNVLATVTLTVTATLTGTLTFTSTVLDTGPYPTQISPPNLPYQPAPASSVWTSTPGANITRGDALSLFLALGNTAKAPTNAQYQVYLAVNI